MRWWSPEHRWKINTADMAGVNKKGEMAWPSPRVYGLSGISLFFQDTDYIFAVDVFNAMIVVAKAGEALVKAFKCLEVAKQRAV